MNSILNAKTSTGGAVARNGFEYQDAYALLKLPQWLAQDAFVEFISEAIGDLEVCYFTQAGVKRVFHEAKNHVLTSTDFWVEVEQFKTAFDKGAGVYEHFVLVTPRLPGPLSPLFTLLERIRGVGSGAGGAPLLVDARREFIERVVKEKKSEALANFILERVSFEEFDATAAEARFPGEMLSALPVFDGLPSRRLRDVQEKLDTLVRKSFRQGVTRAELENTILGTLADGEAAAWAERPSQVKLLRADGDAVQTYELGLDLRPFVGPERSSLGTAKWRELHATAVRAGEFLQASRPGRRKVLLPAELRMSAAVVVGHAFKAARGHVLLLKHRETTYDLGKHEHAARDFFAANEGGGSPGTTEAVVDLEIGPLTDDVTQACATLGLSGLPRLRLTSGSGLPDLAVLNKAVSEARQHLARFRAQLGASVIHLFVKGPSFFAMALGHRLNGVGDVQLYDWMGSHYAATARLESVS